MRGSTHFTFHGGAPISYIYISCFHDDVIKWKHVPRHWLLCGEFTGDCGEFTGHWSFDALFDLRRIKRLRKQSRRRWFETPARSLLRHCKVVPNSDPGSRGIFRRHSCPILNWWNGSNWGFPGIMKGMASNLAHCSTLITIPWNQLNFALSGSLSLWWSDHP